VDYDYVVENAALETAVEGVRTILAAERCRVERVRRLVGETGPRAPKR
jgi:guanylate kinase